MTVARIQRIGKITQHVKKCTLGDRWEGFGCSNILQQGYICVCVPLCFCVLVLGRGRVIGNR